MNAIESMGLTQGLGGLPGGMEAGTPGYLLTRGMSQKEQVCTENMVNHHSNVNDETDTE